ncbi:hypothetical protein NT05HA_0463 [Aggregatibacter aphrophilus NJ8700]|nr:hypothetical protein NT05HA_0463 [Aggregatibacter aphrophilus NJ8700]
MVSDVKYGSNDDVRPKNIVIHNSPQKKTALLRSLVILLVVAGVVANG